MDGAGQKRRSEVSGDRSFIMSFILHVCHHRKTSIRPPSLRGVDSSCRLCNVVWDKPLVGSCHLDSRRQDGLVELQYSARNISRSLVQIELTCLHPCET